MNAGESLKEAAERELVEETGYSGTIKVNRKKEITKSIYYYKLDNSAHHTESYCSKLKFAPLQSV